MSSTRKKCYIWTSRHSVLIWNSWMFFLKLKFLQVTSMKKYFDWAPRKYMSIWQEFIHIDCVYMSKHVNGSFFWSWPQHDMSL